MTDTKPTLAWVRQVGVQWSWSHDSFLLFAIAIFLVRILCPQQQGNSATAQKLSLTIGCRSITGLVQRLPELCQTFVRYNQRNLWSLPASQGTRASLPGGRQVQKVVQMPGFAAFVAREAACHGGRQLSSVGATVERGQGDPGRKQQKAASRKRAACCLLLSSSVVPFLPVYRLPPALILIFLPAPTSSIFFTVSR